MAFTAGGNGNSMFLLGAVAGAIVGAGVALLVAPKAGAEIRGDLGAGFASLKQTVARRYKEVADRASSALDTLEENAEHMAGQAHV